MHPLRARGGGSPATSRAQWSRARVAHVKARTDPAGLRFCGMVDESPAAPSVTSPTSVWASSTMSDPILAASSGDRGQRGTDLNERDSVGVP